jgi:hypothetical protein
MFLYTACYMIKYSCDSPLIGTLAKVGNFSNIITKKIIIMKLKLFLLCLSLIGLYSCSSSSDNNSRKAMRRLVFI